MELVTTPSGELYLDLLIKTLCGWVYPESGWQWHKQVNFNGQPMTLPPEFVLMKTTPFDPTKREEGRDWPAIGYSMIGRKRLDNIRYCVEEILRNDVPGDLIETGVWRGGSAMLMRAVLKLHSVSDRRVWLADSFEGMPKPREIEKQVMPRQPDLSGQPYLIASAEEVRANFERMGFLDDQVKFVKGWFNQTLKSLPISQIAVLRIDCDLYESTMDSLTALYNKVSPGGFVIIDDYHDWESSQKATDDFRDQRSIKHELKRIDWSGVYWQVQ